MKHNIKYSLVLFFVLILLGTSSEVSAQWKTYDWDFYKTKFQVPSDFEVSESSETRWSGKNNNITLSIYPRKNENLSLEGMQDALYKWAVSNGVTEIGEVTVLDEQKLNGYWGYMYEGMIDGYPVGTMLIVDPDYPEISLYIWASYREGFEDTIIDILMSFIPM
ncbi:MAG TPA: hypothetical protein PLB59_00695 [Bacteroidales bacterium]|jgi:hypothetical protein|nr:hypothetical protein [Bacteroidales bacterium]HPB24167.1 hypothetical protein [Bacteroidales bacterium]HPI29575.1 hypothetical protein [Bacteroidales bacterium]HQN14764.1 hypothetical protein [Bacteroidales bacterium]HQP14458.1 hypothetical protein [Bacteroidales bacterium]